MPRPRRARGQWQQRAMNVIGRMKGISFPKWLSQYSIVVYLVALMMVNFMYSTYSLPWYYLISGIISVLIFFIYGRQLGRNVLGAIPLSNKKFENRIFLVSFLLRLVFTLIIYYSFQSFYGDFFGFENADAGFYDDQAKYFASELREGHLLAYWKKTSETLDISDMGYATYVGVVYAITDNSILAVRILKCFWSALTVVLLYRLASRNFGSKTARVAAIFCALWPNFWYYCSAHLKETEMVFLSVLFIEQADQMLRSRQFTAWKVIPVILIATTIFTFRTALALVALVALIFSVVMSSTKVVKWGKRIIVGGLAVLLIGITMGNRIEEQSRQLFDKAKGNFQTENMEWRSQREHGNSFAKYAGSAVFAPMIFTLPFPTMVKPFEGQDQQQLLNGGNYIKNIISFFTILALFVMLLTGRWREHLLPLAFAIGYVVVLAFSTFAQSERFHQPAMPFEFMFAAYGLSIAVTKPKYKRWFTYWCVLMFIAAIAWNWFKLAGRGLA